MSWLVAEVPARSLKAVLALNIDLQYVEACHRRSDLWQGMGLLRQAAYGSQIEGSRHSEQVIERQSRERNTLETCCSSFVDLAQDAAVRIDCTSIFSWLYQLIRIMRLYLSPLVQKIHFAKLQCAPCQRLDVHCVFR